MFSAKDLFKCMLCPGQDLKDFHIRYVIFLVLLISIVISKILMLISSLFISYTVSYFHFLKIFLFFNYTISRFMFSLNFFHYFLFLVLFLCSRPKTFVLLYCFTPTSIFHNINVHVLHRLLACLEVGFWHTSILIQ